MRILQVTNIASHHQMPLARCLANLAGDADFRFAAVRPFLTERSGMGWKPDFDEPWILKTSGSCSDSEICDAWWNDADLVITGERDIGRIGKRLSRKKLTFYMSERWLKPPIGVFRMLWPEFAKRAFDFRRLSESDAFHYLAIGPYAAKDMRLLSSFGERFWKWGYFTDTSSTSACGQRSGGEPLQILWAGRMLGWKQVDTLIRAFAMLVRKSGDAVLTLVGDGKCRKTLENLCEKLDIDRNVRFLPSMPVENVRRLMRESHIYVLPSNGYEGWGAVVNEAMAEGCAVVASRETGAAASLIADGLDGFLFAAGDWRRLGELLILLESDETLRMRLAAKGQETIKRIWAPRIAADRLVSVAQALLAGSSPPVYDEGPMSPVWALRERKIK